MFKSLFDISKQRRSIREFKSEKIDMTLIKNAIQVAGYAPSGANKQPWTFCVVVDPKIRSKIRKKAEEIETDLYENKISKEWREDLRVLETNSSKPFLEKSGCLIVVFKQITGLNGEKHYYVNESVGLATGALVQSLNVQGIDTLTYTPSPMNFLSDILNRPSNERPYMVIVCGKREVGYTPIQVSKKPIDEIMKIY